MSEETRNTTYDGAPRQGNMLPRLLTASQVADVLQISRSMAYGLIQRGDIPSIHLGRAVRVRPADLNAFIEAQVSASNGAQPIGVQRCNN